MHSVIKILIRSKCSFEFGHKTTTRKWQHAQRGDPFPGLAGILSPAIPYHTWERVVGEYMEKRTEEAEEGNAGQDEMSEHVGEEVRVVNTEDLPRQEESLVGEYGTNPKQNRDSGTATVGGSGAIEKRGETEMSRGNDRSVVREKHRRRSSGRSASRKRGKDTYRGSRNKREKGKKTRRQKHHERDRGKGRHKERYLSPSSNVGRSTDDDSTSESESGSGSESSSAILNGIQ